MSYKHLQRLNEPKLRQGFWSWQWGCHMCPLEETLQLSTWAGARRQKPKSKGVVRKWGQGVLTMLQKKIGNEQIVDLAGERGAKIEFSCV